MRMNYVITGTCAVFLCLFSVRADPKSQTPGLDKPTPLILEKNEGERRVWRGWPGHPEPGPTFALKVDPKNGGSSQLVFGTEEMPPGDKIDTHRHPGADEILFLQTGMAEVHLGDSVRIVHGGATVFIPANTSISVSNVGNDVIDLAFVFSAPGFEEFMRDASAREGDKNTPLSKAENDDLENKHLHAVIYK